MRRPTEREIDRFLQASHDLPLSYEPVGSASQRRPGFDFDEHVTVVGNDDAAYIRAKAALARWKHFQLGWADLFPRQPPIDPGTVVAVMFRHVGFWSLNGCRVVYRIGGEDDVEFGFAYGTLANHAECGEEIFKVALDTQTGDVSYTIRAVSKPRVALARLGYPVVRLLQARFRRDSARAVAAAIRGTQGPRTP
jgi:uncharacterized protein (UPF0548 family)